MHKTVKLDQSELFFLLEAISHMADSEQKQKLQNLLERGQWKADGEERKQKRRKILQELNKKNIFRELPENPNVRPS